MNNGTPSVRSMICSAMFFGQRLAAGHEGDHLGTLLARQAIEREHRHMRAPDPRRRELRPERDDHQHPKPWHPINDKVEGLACRRVTPMHVLPHHQDGLTCSQPLDLRHLGLKRLLLALLRT